MASSSLQKNSPESPEVREGWVQLQRARVFMKSKFEYFMPIILGMIPEHLPGLNTCAVSNGLVLFIDMEWYIKHTVPQCGGLLAHEASHVMRDLKRINALPNHRLASLAFDLPINDNLKAAGIELPEGGFYSSSFGLKPGLPGEAYYHLLEDRFKTKDLGTKDALGRDQYVIIIDDKEITAKAGSGMCGSCSGENSSEKEVAVDAEIGRSQADINYIRKSGIYELKKAMKSGKLGGPGNQSGMWQEIIDMSEAPPPVVPWKQELGNIFRYACGRIRAGQSDFSIRRPSRRSYTSGILRPGMITYDPEVIIIEDVSGSMGKEQLVTGRVEVINAMNQLGITNFWYLQADAQVTRDPKRIRPKDLYDMPANGRGGTSFRAAIEAAQRLRPKPKLAIYITDGDAFDVPERAPMGMEFIWLIVPSPYQSKPCNWGRHIIMSDDRAVREQYEDGDE